MNSPTKCSAKDFWCVKCHNYFYKIAERAKEFGATLISGIFEKGHLTFKCRLGHLYKMSPHRNPNQEGLWCTLCRDAKRQQMRDQMEADMRRKNLEMQEAQRKLFAQMGTQSTEPPTTNNTEIMGRVQSIAYRLMTETLRTNPNWNREQIYNMYKIIHAPVDILIQGFKTHGDTMPTAFRKMSLLIHPDKNHHPHANYAFRKLNDAYEKAQ